MSWQTAVLSLIIGQLVALGAALARSDRNSTANRLLALWLIVAAGLLAPFALNYAGAYRQYDWLAFAPLAIPLAVGPLAWAYVHTLLAGVPPRHLSRHLALPLVQFGYTLACFVQPVARKEWWSAQVHEPWVVPWASIVSLASLATYAVLALFALRRYRVRLSGERSDDERFAGRWIGRALGAVLLILALRLIYQGAEAVSGQSSYSVVFSFYSLFGLVALYIGIEGWRHAGLTYPDFAAPPAADPIAPKPGPDWREMGRRWSEQVRVEGWWREPELDLPTLARRLGTNRSHLSRALNEGLGTTFSAFVNGLRAEAVAERLRAGDSRDFLSLALDLGFNSKASFNRAFATRFGQSPTAYRRAVAAHNVNFDAPPTE